VLLSLGSEMAVRLREHVLFPFVVSYIVNHALLDTIFSGHGLVRTLYLSILARHVILSTVALPVAKAEPTNVYDRSKPFGPSTRISQFSLARDPAMDTRQSPRWSANACSVRAVMSVHS